MNVIKTLSLAGLLALAGTASATSFVVTTDAVVGAVGATSEASSDVSSSFTDDKIVLAARDDAAAFVASQGGIRGVRLEAARRRYAVGDGDPESLRTPAASAWPEALAELCDRMPVQLFSSDC